MSDTWTNPLAGFKSFFSPGDVNDPRVNQTLRQKIALAMLAKEQRFPKTIGEGLSAIGDAIGQRRMMEELMQQDLSAQDTANKVFPVPGAKTSEDTTTATKPPAVAAVAPQPSNLTTAPEQPASMLNPTLPSALGQTPTPAQAMAIPPAAAPGATDQSDPWTARSAAVSGIETGGAKDPYTSVGAQTRTGDRAYGKYQVMGANIPSWTQAALGQPMTPQQFLADKDAQEAVFKHRFGGYVDKYGEEGAAKAWFAGEGGMNNPNATDVHGRLNVAGYGQDYLKRLAAAGGGPRDAVTAQLVARQQPPSPDTQDTTFADVMSTNRPPPPSFAPTAINRTGDVQSDAPPITGALTGPAGQSVADTVQQRQQALQSPQPFFGGAQPPVPAGLTPPQTGEPQPNVRMAQVAPAPGVVSDIRQAPQPPQVRAAPATADQISPGYVLPEPKPLPPKQILPQHPDVADALLKMRKYPGNQYVADQAAQVIKLREDQRAQQQAAIDEDYKNAQTQQREMTKLYQEQKATATQRGLTEAKTRQDLLGEGFTPMTQDQIKSLYPMGGQPAEGQSFWMNRRGEVKTGPAPPTSIDLRQESGEASTRGKLSAEAERKLIDAADKAGSDLYTIRRAQALQDQIKTGALEPSRMTIGAYAKSAGLSPETFKSLNLDPNGVGSQQAFDAINKELTLTKIGAGGMPVNNFSEADRNFVSSIVSGLGDDPVSNRIKLEVLAAAKTRDLEKAQAWAAFRRDPANATKRGEPPSFTDFEFNWNDQIKNKDVLGHLRAEAEAQIAKAKEQSGQQTPPTVSDGATATGPNGARLIRRGGKWEPM